MSVAIVTMIGSGILQAHTVSEAIVYGATLVPVGAAIGAIIAWHPIWPQNEDR